MDIRSDLYSLGVTLWDMLAGEVPFRGTPAEVMYEHLHAPLPLEQRKAVPQPVLLLIEKLLEKDPAQRFQTPDELLNALPTVKRAIEAKRTVKHQEARTTFVDKPSSRQEKSPAIRAPKRFLGNFEASRQYAMQAVHIWRSGSVQSNAEEYYTPVVGCLVYVAMSEWHLGEIASCHVMMAEAISLAKKLNDTNALAYALGWAAALAAIERDPAEVDRLASESVKQRLTAYGTLGYTGDALPKI